MPEIENEYGMVLGLHLEDEYPKIIVREKSEKTPRLVFILSDINIDEIKRQFKIADANSFYLQMSRWLENEQKELVMKEDLIAMMNVIAHSIGDMYNRRNALVEAINRLEVIYDRYKEKDNENSIT